MNKWSALTLLGLAVVGVAAGCGGSTSDGDSGEGELVAVGQDASTCGDAGEGELVCPVGSTAMEPTLRCGKPRGYQPTYIEKQIARFVPRSAPKASGPQKDVVGCTPAVSDEVVVEQGAALERGEIFVFKSTPAGTIVCGAPNREILRVIALPGDTWEARNGIFYVNGSKLAEPYIAAGHRGALTYPLRTVRPGRFLAFGDNRTQSCDSRETGGVLLERVIGKVVGVRPAGKSGASQANAP